MFKFIHICVYVCVRVCVCVGIYIILYDIICHIPVLYYGMAVYACMCVSIDIL